MPTIPIPADKVAIVPGTQYQLTGLVAAKRYVFKVNTDRPVEVLITKEEAGTTVQASGRLYNREVAFTTDAAQTSAYFTVIGLSEAKVTLSMIQKDAPAIGNLPSPAQPDLWYNVPNALTPGSVYKITCSDPMATVLLRFMDDSLNNVVAEATPLLPGWDAVFVTAVTANLQVLLDGVSPAVITVSPVVCSPGSGGSLTPSSDANITGAWNFTNITVPTPTQPGQAANKEYVDNQLGATVKTTGNQTISGVKTFSDSPVVPAPTSDTNAVNKQYVDAAIEAIPVFNPAEAQTISGSWNFTNGLTRTTKASPVNTDIMNKQMSDALYVPATGNTTIAGTKTFSDGITLGDEKLLTLGIGANAMKIHGSGTGAAVIEGANGTSLVAAVSTEFFEPVTFQDKVTITAPAQANGGVTFTSGVTIAQTLNVAGPAIFTGGIKGSKFESTVGNITFTNSYGIVTMVLTNADNTGSIFHKSLDPTDPSPSNPNVNKLAVYAVGQLDNRYAKLETSLTQDQYDALSIKDPRTFYFTSDTSKLYIGGTLVNPT